MEKANYNSLHTLQVNERLQKHVEKVSEKTDKKIEGIIIKDESNKIKIQAHKQLMKLNQERQKGHKDSQTRKVLNRALVRKNDSIIEIQEKILKKNQS